MEIITQARSLQNGEKLERESTVQWNMAAFFEYLVEVGSQKNPPSQKAYDCSRRMIQSHFCTLGGLNGGTSTQCDGT